MSLFFSTGSSQSKLYMPITPLDNMKAIRANVREPFDY